MSLKQAVEASQGEAFPAQRQVLVYKGKILEDQTTLEQAEVSEAGFLVVTVKKPFSKAKQPTAPPKVEAAEAVAPAVPPAPAAKEAPPAPTPSPAPEGAPAARAEGAASGAPVPAEEGLIQGAASNLATGSALEAAVSSICDMGFPKEQVMKAMRAAFNNPDRAVEYLMNGIPEQEPEVPQAVAPILAGAGGEAGAGAGAGAGMASGDGRRVVLCPQCQGAGLVKEVDNFRELEHNCDHCDGEGTYITVKGVRQSAADPAGQKHMAEGDHAPGARVVALKSRVARLEQQREGYEKEISGLRAKIDGGGEGPGGEEWALLDSLLTQLRLMVDKVEAEREKAATLVLQAQHLQDEEDSSVSAGHSDEDSDEVPGLTQ